MAGIRCSPAAMATYSFPALGFDPAPGDVDALDAVARDCLRCANDLSADADVLKRLFEHIDWQGEAADAFVPHHVHLHDDLVRASDAHGGAGTALMTYSAALRQAKLDARRLEEDAAEARDRADHHGAEVDRLSKAMDSAPPGTVTADREFQRTNALRLQTQAHEDHQSTVARARRLQRAHDEDADRAAAHIRALSDAPYHDPGLVARVVGDAADWVNTHADGLRAVSNLLKTVSLIAGALSFIPFLTPLCAPIAGIAAVGALATDAALAATGHGDWKVLAVDAALMVLPGAGRLASEAAMGSRAARAAREYADETQVLRLPNRMRPATVGALVVRRRTANVFRGTSRGSATDLDPRLQAALDRVPVDLRPGITESARRSKPSTRRSTVAPV
jgi:hypothetical protein